MSARIEFLSSSPPGAGRGEMDAPFHAPAPPQAARETPVYIYLECRWREALMAKSGGGFYPHPADPQKSLFLTRTVFITIA